LSIAERDGTFSGVEANPAKPLLLVMGGTFDPPHLGHLLLAQDAVEATGADRLLFVPAGRNPHKVTGPLASGEHRLGMLRAATAHEPRFEVSEIEVRREGPSYALETVRAVAAQYPQHRLGWLFGADQWVGLPRWHRIEELVEEVEFHVLARPGALESPPDLPGLRWQPISARLIEISATEIRKRLADRKPIDFFVPKSVLEYIEKHPVYS
jgi:nicotinate-nucleotide adenylyltransferase